MEFWNSVTQLVKLNTCLQMALVFFGIITGLIGAASFIVGHRKDTLVAGEEVKLRQQIGTIEQRTADVRNLQYRHLSKEQKEKLRAAIEGIKNIKVLVIWHNSKESRCYASEIDSIFKSVGWELEHLDVMSQSRNVVSPEICLNTNIPQSSEFERLKTVISEIGLPFKFGRFSSNSGSQISLDVGVIPANDYQALTDKYR